MSDILNFSTANEEVSPEVVAQNLPKIAPPTLPKYGNIENGATDPSKKTSLKDSLFNALDNIETSVNNQIGNSPIKSFSQQETYKFNTSTNPITRALFGDYTSRYNKYLPGGDNETINAQEQGAWGVAGNALGGMLFNAGEAYAGYIGANGKMISAAANGDFSKIWDTEFTENQAKDLATASDFFAIYHDASKPSGLSSYIPFASGSGEKWGHLIQSFGFTAGTLGGVATENLVMAYVTGGLGNLAKGSKTMKGIFDAFRMLSFGDKSVDALKGLSMGQKIATKGLQGLKYANVATNAVISEGAMEAAMASNEFQEEEIAKYKEIYGLEPSEEDIQKIIRQREEVGDTTFSYNAPILGVSNLFMFGNFMRTGRFFEKPASELLSGAVREGTRAVIKKGLATTAWRSAKKIGGVVPEGLEEMSQSIASESAKRHYSLFKADTGKSFLDTMVSTTGDLSKNGRLAEDFLSGVIIGGITMGIGTINDKFKGASKLTSEDALSTYNTTISENVASAIEGLSNSRRMPGQVFGIAGAQTARSILGGMEGMNAMAGQTIAAQDKNKKDFYDEHNEALKTIAYTAKVNGMSEITKEIINESIDVIPNDEYASQYMSGSVAPTEQQIQDHKEGKKAEYAKMQNEFDKTWDDVDYKYGNPYDIKTNPHAHQSFEEVKRDIVFYKEDYRNAIERHKSLNNSISEGLNKFYDETGIKVEEKDIDVIVSPAEREKEIKKIDEQEKSLELNLSALDDTIHTEQKLSIRADLLKLRGRKENLQILSEASIAAERMDEKDNSAKKVYQKAVDLWLERTTGMRVGEDHPLMEDIRHSLILNAEARFLLSLHNALMSNGKLMNNYFYKYSKAGRQAQEQGLRELQEKRRQDQEIEDAEISTKTSLDDQFTNEELNEMKEALGVNNLYDVDKSYVQNAIDKLEEEANPNNTDLVLNLEALRDGAYAPSKEVATEENRKDVEEQIDAAKKEQESIEKAIENEKQKQEEITTSNKSEIEAKKADIENEISKLPNNLLFITHITSSGNAQVIYNDRLLMPAGVSSTTGIVNKESLKNLLFDLVDGKSPHRGYFDLFLGAIDRNILESTNGKTLQDKLENYIDDNFIDDAAKTQLPSSLNVGYFTNGILSTDYSAGTKVPEESQDITLQNEKESQVSDVENLTSNEQINAQENEKTNKRTTDQRNEDITRKALASERRRKARESRAEEQENRKRVKDFLAESIDLTDKVKYQLIMGRKLTKEAMRSFFSSGLERKIRFGWVHPNGSKSIDGFGEEAILELPESLQDSYAPTDISSAVEEVLNSYSNNAQIYQDVLRQLENQDSLLDQMNDRAKEIYDKEDLSNGLSRHINELIDKSEDILNNLTDDEIIELRNYLQTITSTPFASEIEEVQEERIKKSLDDRGIAYQKISKSENILSPSEVKIARKLLSRAFPNILEMTDEEVFKAMEGKKFPIGMLLSGKMWINSERETLETRMHELGGHVFFLTMKSQYPSLYNRLMSQLGKAISKKSDKELNSVANIVKEFYPELQENSPQFNEEVMAMYMGQIMTEGVAKAINSNGLKADIAYWLNYIYERVMNLLGIDNYLSMDKFANNTLGENLVHIGKGILNGRVRLDISTDELATMMSASPTYMKGITKEWEELKKAIDLLPVLPEVVQKNTIVHNSNKTKDEFDKERDGNFSFLSLYDMGVSVDEIMVSAKDYDKDNHIVKKLSELTNEPVDSKDIVQIFYSNGLGNILTNDELIVLEQLGIRAFDSSLIESYTRGRIFFYRNTPSDITIKKTLEEVAKLSFPDKKGVHKLTKNGSEILSTSDLSQKVNKDALLRLKPGEKIAVSVDFDNKWNESIVQKLMNDTPLNRKDIDTMVLTYKNQSGDILGYVRALGGEFDKETKDKRKDRVDQLRRKASETLYNAIKNKDLATRRILSIQREMELESTTNERKIFLKKLIEDAYKGAEIKNFLPLDIFSFNALGAQAIYNETLDTWMSVSEFLQKRNEVVEGNQDFQLAYFKKNKNGEWRYFNQNGKEIDIAVDNFKKYEAIYLVSPNYQRRVYFETLESGDINYEDFQSLDQSVVNTRLRPDKPYLDVRLKVDFGVEAKVERTTSNLEESILNLNGELSQEQEDEGKDIEVTNDVTDEVLTSTDDLESIPTAPKVSQQDEEFIYDLIPLYYGLDINKESFVGENRESYAMQEIMIDEMNDGLMSRGLKLTKAVGEMPREYFKKILKDYISLKNGQINLKEFIFNIVKYKKSMDNQVLIEGNELIAPAKAPKNGRIIRIDEVKIDRLTLLYDVKNIYIQHKDTNFYYEFPKNNNLQIEKQVKNAIREVMIANGEKLSNFEAFYQEYTHNNLDLSVNPYQRGINLIRVATEPYAVYKLIAKESIADDIKC